MEQTETDRAEPWGRYAELCRGRLPSAVACLKREGTDLEGSLRCYDTPLGLLMFARLWGEKSVQEGVFRFGFLDRSKAGKRESRCLPLLYVRDGEARGCMLTREIGLPELMTRGLYVEPLSDGDARRPSDCRGAFLWERRENGTRMP